MSIYAISDLHLSFGTEKPMDKFGKVWEDYEERMKYNWNKVVKENDLVLVPGDVSWATYLSEAVEDFKFIDGLNGEKLISKGNHDYWWETLTKLNKFLEKNSYTTIRFMHNTVFEYNEYVICAAKGFDNTCEAKIVNRETERICLSLNKAKKTNKKIILMLHYPPFDKEGRFHQNLYEILNSYEPSFCIYGHLHGKGRVKAIQGLIGNTEYKLVSCDCIDFKPVKI